MTVEEIARQWIEDAQQRIVKQYNDLGLKASGKFERDIENKVEVVPQGLQMVVLGVPYSGIMVSGRNANSDQSKEGLRKFVGWAGSTILKDWVNDKGLSISPFAVAYKIAKKGILVPNQYNSGALLDTAATDEDLNELGRMIGREKISEIRRDVTKQFSNNGNN